jgi:hypothetical protein
MLLEIVTRSFVRRQHSTYRGAMGCCPALAWMTAWSDDAAVSVTQRCDMVAHVMLSLSCRWQLGRLALHSRLEHVGTRAVP